MNYQNHLANIWETIDSQGGWNKADILQIIKDYIEAADNKDKLNDIQMYWEIVTYGKVRNKINKTFRERAEEFIAFIGISDKTMRDYATDRLIVLIKASCKQAVRENKQ